MRNLIAALLLGLPAAAPAEDGVPSKFSAFAGPWWGTYSSRAKGTDCGNAKSEGRVRLLLDVAADGEVTAASFTPLDKAQYRDGMYEGKKPEKPSRITGRISGDLATLTLHHPEGGTCNGRPMSGPSRLSGQLTDSPERQEMLLSAESADCGGCSMVTTYRFSRAQER